MYKELKENEIKTYNQIGKQYPKLATILINPTQPRYNGIILEARGQLYAVADQDSRAQLLKAARKLEDQGIELIIDLMHLEYDKMFFIG